MGDLRRLTKNSSLKRTFGAALVALSVSIGASAKAATAVYDSSIPYTPGPQTSLSTAGDGLGQLVPLGEWFSLLFSQPFGVSKSDTVSIFTVAPPSGSARLSISFGNYNGGSPVYATTKIVNAGNNLTVNNLFQQGCSALGGCDFIFITTIRQRGGATGATVDYVSVNGETTEVTAPTPELSVWSMMILGFAGVGWRMKALRNYSFSSA